MKNQVSATQASQIISEHETNYALILRQATPNMIDLLIFNTSTVDDTTQIADDDQATKLVLLPYRSIKERGFSAQDDKEPILICTVSKHYVTNRHEFERLDPERTGYVDNFEFDISDAEYADIASASIVEDIGSGLGSNFVLKRTLQGTLSDSSNASLLGLYKRLLQREAGAYWTFLVSTNDRIFLGASPERHVSLDNSIVAMTPISGTLRAVGHRPTSREVQAFLADQKEADELLMVLDEELKMMASLCPEGAAVVGPRVRRMSNVVHTEFEISGRTSAEISQVLRGTLLAPTVVGSPLESAAKVIHKREPSPRGYYSGVLALVEVDSAGRQSLDSAILIRTAEISRDGDVRISAGSTIVRHSDPASEAQETRAKTAGLRQVFERETSLNASIDQAMTIRRAVVSDFWLKSTTERAVNRYRFSGRTCLIVTAEDDFTHMLAVLLRSLGFYVDEQRAIDVDELPADRDLILFGPGPGNPENKTDQRIVSLHRLIRSALLQRRPFLAECLSHQILALELGLPIARLAKPHQGEQIELPLWNRQATLGFYNTYTARSSTPCIDSNSGRHIQAILHPDSQDIAVLRGTAFASIQFHIESVLTHNNDRLLAELIQSVLSRSENWTIKEVGSGTSVRIS
ncbi:phenazine biosynthesis protein phzE [Brevibacterium iodinum ATCC 49514]|uniref:anthranilate synthase n=1 Tax=Brevibacterium iodinum ATCC 49514 TaxID=1255616 RepID=A0A2H1KKK6_9MICO|nr:anthranilate synthase family protein [Brevibacterium iodinum]SMY00343.1 phenazine biosynthesis protein phzE [Brevibacterium iodinum ATCC 49514]SUW70207.1 Anthranilate synthase component 1 [Brevibacterium iodinum]